MEAAEKADALIKETQKEIQTTLKENINKVFEEIFTLDPRLPLPEPTTGDPIIQPNVLVD